MNLLLNCPGCGSRGIGKVGTDQYYCWDCCVEFSMTKKGIQIYEVDLEGELVAIASPEAQHSVTV